MAITSQQMREDREMVPRILIRAVGLLLAACLGIAVYARVTDQPLVSQWPEIEVVEEQTVRIFAEMSGAARVFNTNGELVADLSAEEGGFIAGVTRAMARERLKFDVASDAPVRIVRFADGRLGLRDDLSGWRVELLGFGVDNTAAFDRLLRAATALEQG